MRCYNEDWDRIGHGNNGVTMGVALIPRKSYDYDNQDRTGQDRTQHGLFSPVSKYEGCNTTILKPF
jgi:hypothetical protein